MGTLGISPYSARSTTEFVPQVTESLLHRMQKWMQKLFAWSDKTHSVPLGQRRGVTPKVRTLSSQ